MAITTQRVYLEHDVDADFAPAGHAVPTTSSSIGTIADEKKGVQFSITASTDVNANKVTAFDALILTSLVAAIDAWIAATGGTPEGLGVAITNTVQYNYRITEVKRGINGLDNDILLTAATDAFVITGDFEYATS